MNFPALSLHFSFVSYLSCPSILLLLCDRLASIYCRNIAFLKNPIFLLWFLDYPFYFILWKLFPFHFPSIIFCFKFRFSSFDSLLSLHNSFYVYYELIFNFNNVLALRYTNPANYLFNLLSKVIICTCRSCIIHR